MKKLFLMMNLFSLLVPSLGLDDELDKNLFLYLWYFMSICSLVPYSSFIFMALIMAYLSNWRYNVNIVNEATLMGLLLLHFIITTREATTTRSEEE